MWGGFFVVWLVLFVHLLFIWQWSEVIVWPNGSNFWCGFIKKGKKKFFWHLMLVVAQGGEMTITPAITSLSPFPILPCGSGLSEC